jgi:hypothetical protein
LHISEDELLQKYLPFDKSVPYKDLLISPIRLKDIYDVQEILNILQKYIVRNGIIVINMVHCGVPT